MPGIYKMYEVLGTEYRDCVQIKQGTLYLI